MPASILVTILAGISIADFQVQDETAPHKVPGGMVWIEGGEFTMGGVGTQARPDELPPHRVRVDGFFISETEVTNAQFRVFVDATGYVTVAEQAVEWEEIRTQVPPGTPKPDDSVLQPGSLVFHETGRPVDPRDISKWWRWTINANWRMPEGPDSSIDNRLNHPVVHVAWEDAVAYARWAGGELPTEAQWEFAARGGLDGKVYVWGDAEIDETRANTWQGRFPVHDEGVDGYRGTAPVKSFPPNGYGLYEMGGNVWEWCQDLYDARAYQRRLQAAGLQGVTDNPSGPDKTVDPRNPHTSDTRVQRGGSFLCNPSYCSSYRPSARMSATPDSGMSHAGFRIVMTPAQAALVEKRSNPSP